MVARTFNCSSNEVDADSRRTKEAEIEDKREGDEIVEEGAVFVSEGIGAGFFRDFGMNSSIESGRTKGFDSKKEEETERTAGLDSFKRFSACALFSADLRMVGVLLMFVIVFESFEVEGRFDANEVEDFEEETMT